MKEKVDVVFVDEKGVVRMKRKHMKREEWHRVLQKEYRCMPCEFEGIEGLVSILVLKEVTAPLYVPDEDKKVLIADVDYSWLQVALKNQYFWITSMFDTKGQLLQVYFDISKGTIFEEEENPCFDDMYLDIVLTGDGRLYILDQEELEEARQEGVISEAEYEHAIVECNKLYQYLTEHKEKIMEFCKEWYQKLR